MRTRRFTLIVAAVLAFTASALRAQTGNAAALTGQVTSSDDGAMEGVLVSAKKPDSTITITVVSDAQGRYRFPTSKLSPGSYALSIRAAGYDLDGPDTATVTAQKTTTADLELRKTKDLAAQLTNGEWLRGRPTSGACSSTTRRTR